MSLTRPIHEPKLIDPSIHARAGQKTLKREVSAGSIEITGKAKRRKKGRIAIHFV